MRRLGDVLPEGCGSGGQVVVVEEEGSQEEKDNSKKAKEEEEGAEKMNGDGEPHNKEEAAKKMEEANTHEVGKKAHAMADGHELASQTKPFSFTVLFSKGGEGQAASQLAIENTMEHSKTCHPSQCCGCSSMAERSCPPQRRV